VKVLSSEGRMSAWILGLMPFFLAGIINMVNPEFMSPLWTDPIGITIVQNMLILMLVGAIIMRKIIKIRV
jgi:tight adherence protein B